jgi:hypothetical protein
MACMRTNLEIQIKNNKIGIDLILLRFDFLTFSISLRHAYSQKYIRLKIKMYHRPINAKNLNELYNITVVPKCKMRHQIKKLGTNR